MASLGATVVSSALAVAEHSAFYRRTRRGHVIRIVEESYLRNDLGLGARNGKTLQASDMCALLSGASAGEAVNASGCSWLVPDTNVVLHQMDLLEVSGCALLDHLVILETVAQEVKHNDVSVYRRLQKLLKNDSRKVVFFANEHCWPTHVRRTSGESPNDRNDRAIRVAAAYFAAQLEKSGGGGVASASSSSSASSASPSSSAPSVLLLSDDRLNRAACLAMEKPPACLTVRSFVQRFLTATHPQLADMVAVYGKGNQDHGDEDDEDGDDDEEEDNGDDDIVKDGEKRKLGQGGEQPPGETSEKRPKNNKSGQQPESRKKATAARGGSKPNVFPAHLGAKEVEVAVTSGRLFQGTLRCNRMRWDDCYVVVGGAAAAAALSSSSVGGGGGEEERVSVSVKGMLHCNRAVEGDVVCIELLPCQEWDGAAAAAAAAAAGGGSGSSAGVGSSQQKAKEGADNEEEEDEDETGGATVSEPTAPPKMGDMENVRNPAAGAAGAGGAAKTAVVVPCGKVVGIVRRNWKHYCGSVSLGTADSNEDVDIISGRTSGAVASLLVVPVDKRVPRIRITTRQKDALVGKRIIVAVDAWPAWSKYPQGHYVSTLGTAGEKQVETSVILLEHDIPTGDFSGEVLACLPPEGWAVDATKLEPYRRDLRHLPVMSIDPPGCRDIDDALHWRDLGNGHWEVGIHIADVTHYVSPGSPLDVEASNRSTSTYLVDRRLDMLPKMLTEKLCSLVGNVDRFAFSVLLEVTPTGEIVNADFCKSVIHSVGAHTYAQAQDMLDHPEKFAEEPNGPVKAEAVSKLNHLAKIFRQRRFDAGALTLASPEVRFVLDTQTQNPLDVQMYELKETNALVEEFMLLANITVGKKILRHFPGISCLRRHPAPAKSQFAPLVSAAAAVGVEMLIGDSKELAASLDSATKPDDEYFNKLIRIMCTRCMSPAQYFSSGDQLQEEWRHYGLATPIYTHFTSPIRRYADVVVHRLLAAAIGVFPLPPQLLNKTGMHDLTENMNRRHRAAQLAGRASVGLHTQLYFKDHPATAERAYVLSCHRDKVVVLVPRFGIEGTIWLGDEAARGDVDYDPDAHTLALTNSAATDDTPLAAESSAGSRSVVRVFDSVEVHISVKVAGGGNDDGTGKPMLRVLLTNPPMGEQPESTSTSEVDGSEVDLGAGGGAPAAVAVGSGGAQGKKKKPESNAQKNGKKSGASGGEGRGAKKRKA